MSFVSAVGRLPPQPRLTMLVDAYILTVRRHASVFYLFAPDFTVLAELLLPDERLWFDVRCVFGYHMSTPC